MTSSNSISSAMMVLEFAVLLAVFIACARLKGVHPVTKLLYLMWIATLFISNLYYLTHALQNKGLYLPFSAMDVVSAGLYTLLPAALQQNFSIDLKKVTPFNSAGALFGAINIWLWILWSGSWLGNIINMLPFVYLLYVCSSSLEISGAFRKTDKIALLTASAVISVLETVLYYSEGALYAVLDTVSYIIMFSCSLYLIFRTVDALVRGSADKALALSASSYVMSIITTYMSYEPIYFVAEFMTIVTVALTYLAVRKKGKEASE